MSGWARGVCCALPHCGHVVTAVHRDSCLHGISTGITITCRLGCREMLGIKERMAELRAMHSKATLSRFDDTNEDELQVDVAPFAAWDDAEALNQMVLSAKLQLGRCAAAGAQLGLSPPALPTRSPVLCPTGGGADAADHTHVPQMRGATAAVWQRAERRRSG